VFVGPVAVPKRWLMRYQDVDVLRDVCIHSLERFGLRCSAW
jgi:hypothetical protein